jgi:SAM-dependent methyltransferase
MLDDVQAVADFYATARGRIAARLLRRQLQAVWPDLSGQVVLGLGHTAPYLPLWRNQAQRCIEAATGSGGAATGADCLVQDDALPFADLSVGRVLMAHALENATHAPRMLRAVWRVLRDDGRLLIVMPNRTGLWAHTENTPFADGAPCSTGRIERLLNRSLFRVERLQGALYYPPANLKPLLRIGPVLEAAGRFVTPKLAGVLVVEAVKDVYAAIPAAGATAAMPARRMLVPLGAARAGRSVSDRTDPSTPVPPPRVPHGQT